MKKNELKKVLKPLIKECIKEVIFEEGALSGLISEVMKSAAAPRPEETNIPTMVQENLDTKPRVELEQKAKGKLKETKQKMLDAIGRDSFNGVNLFEGTEPLRSAGSPSGAPSPSDPLSTYAPDDEGVNINGILQIANGKWNKLI